MGNRINGVLFPRGVTDFSLLHIVQTGTRSYQSSYPIGTGGPIPRIKRPERETNNSPPSDAESITAWSYTSNPSYVFIS